MDLAATPRTDEAPPDPGSHILPTPGQTPLELDADVAAVAVVDESTMDVPARIMAAVTSGRADFARLTNPVQNILHTLPL
jgi:hypothetical protein